MDRYQFGQLVAALRKHHFDLGTGQVWTQETLAKHANFSQKIVANIEQGRKTVLEADTLINLANALHLTFMERQEFFALAANATTTGIDLRGHMEEPGKVLDKMLDQLREIRLPAIIYDPFYNVVAVNKLGLTFHSMPELWLNSITAHGEEVNFLLSVLEPQSPMRRILHVVWDQFVRANISQFRVMTLRYRHEASFQHLLDALRHYDEFQTMWLMNQLDDADYGRFQRYKYDHPQHGLLSYAVAVEVVPTIQGKLYFSFLTPMDNCTMTIFHRLAQTVEQYVIRFSPWPSPNLENDCFN